MDGFASCVLLKVLPAAETSRHDCTVKSVMTKQRMHRNIWLAESFRAPALSCIVTYDWLSSRVLLQVLHCDVIKDTYLQNMALLPIS